ncbi:MAG: nucleoside-diphosphate kinase [Opitutaceae bacterium]|jgi:nucleoside-diphosphate kinase|nr:nucleoside-diphosphate kinase [Opitutaceae bacterium]|tara:strand:- start:2769 stop:3185 length:417 start_codon:yes stop_codon:yes gene_type:complete
MEKTFIILKPDCMEQGLAGKVLQRFESEGFSIVATKMTRLESPILREHYAHVANLPFFPDIEAFMSSRSVIMVALQGDNVIQRVRDLLGPTDSTKAPAGTIRGDFGTDMMRNVVHASDGPETSAAELKRFFKDDEIFA